MKKYYIKKNIIGFIVGVILCTGTFVYAAVTFPSNEVSYDNTESGLSSTNVKGAIDELYETCTALSPGEQIIEDNNLEKDFNGEPAGWRIISVGCDGTIKIMRTLSIGNMVWDTSGSNNWARPATLNTNLNVTYLNSLSSEAQGQIVASDYSIGPVTLNNNDLASQVNYENSTTWNGKIALPTLSEYLRTNSNSNCKTFSTYSNNYGTCIRTTWMYYYSGNYWWTLSYLSGTSDNVFFMGVYGDVYFHNPAFDVDIAVRPTITLSSEVKLSGSGTQSDPYVVS